MSESEHPSGAESNTRVDGADAASRRATPDPCGLPTPDDDTRSSDGPEIYIGLITPLGAPSDELEDALKSELARYSYHSHPIRLSKLLERLEDGLPRHSDERTAELIDRGNRLTEIYGAAAVARLGVQELRAVRAEATHDDTGQMPIQRRGWIIRSLKRPDEVTLLRQTYGEALFTLAVHTTKEKRQDRLATNLRSTRPTLSADQAAECASKMIAQDEHEEAFSHGQDVRSAFPMADVMLPGDEVEPLQREARRFVQMLFGENVVPNAAEHAMYMADGTAAMSSSLSRKVGAALVTASGEIISVGANEVPKAGGGQFGFDDPGGRDEDRGVDYSTESLRALVADTVVKLAEGNWLSSERHMQFAADKDLMAREAFDLLRSAKADLLNIIEFQRSVHAEAAAIVEAARRGIAVEGATMYCTTYPCHLCAKEIVYAGITRVYYIEPYPKSRAEGMYGESIHGRVSSDEDNWVAFVPFIGVTPRAYRRLFETEERYRRKDELGLVVRADPQHATPRGLTAFEAVATASEREIFAIGNLPADPTLAQQEGTDE